MLRMVGMVNVMDVRVETVVLVGRISHLPDATVRLDEAVLPVDHVSVAVLRLVFLVAGVRIFDAVLVRVMGRRLMDSREQKQKSDADEYL